MTETPEGSASAELPAPDRDENDGSGLPPAQNQPASYGYGSPAAGTDRGSLSDEDGSE